VRADRGEEVVLALRLRADRLSSPDGFQTVRQVLRRCRVEGIGEQALRVAPVGDRAGGGGLHDLLERASRGAVPERMLEQHRPVEQRLGPPRAPSLEVDPAQPILAPLGRGGAPAGLRGARTRGGARGGGGEGGGREGGGEGGVSGWGFCGSWVETRPT